MSDENTTRTTVDAGEHRDEAAELPTAAADETAVVEPAAADAAVVETIAVDAMLNEGAPAATPAEAAEAVEIEANEVAAEVQQEPAAQVAVDLQVEPVAVATHAVVLVTVPVKASSGYCSNDLHLQPGDARTLADIAAGLTATGQPTATAGEALHAVLEQIRQLMPKV